MEFSNYNLDSKNSNIEVLEKQSDAIFQVNSDFSDTESEKFILTAKLYKDCYNLLAKDILIKKLKLSEQTAKKIHFSAWEKIDIAHYNPARGSIINLYLSLINNLASECIKIEFESSGETVLNQLIHKQSDNDENIIKKRWSFVWKFISNIDENTKKIFMYKLYAGLGFDDISKILKIQETEIKQMYLEKESELFNTTEFKEFFNIR